MQWQNPTIYNHETILKTAFGAFSKPYVLVHVPKCKEIAGAGVRDIPECYRVIHMFDGNRHSKAFKTLEQAQAEFDTWTKPICEVKHA